MKTRNRPALNVGISSIIVIFAILCLVIFAALSLTSASADYRLTEKLKEHTDEYYSACSAAEDLLDEIDRRLADAHAETASGEDVQAAYFGRVISSLSELSGLSGLEITETYDTVTVHFSTPISAEQSLEVSLTVLCPQEPGDRFYRVDSWKAVATGESVSYTHLTLPTIRLV